MDDYSSFGFKLEFMRPIYKPIPGGVMPTKHSILKYGMERIFNRIEEKELLEIQDMRLRLCLTQRWPSLLIRGITQ